jgi:hypothetical protein
MSTTLQMLVWQTGGEQQTLWGNIKAARVQGDRLEVLVSSDPTIKPVSVPNLPPTLAFTEAALQWLTPETLSLNEWLQKYPAWEKPGMAALIQELRPLTRLSSDPQAARREFDQVGAGNWTVQTAHLTHSPQPDLILTLTPDNLAALGYSAATQSRTVIISDRGKLIYSELSVDGKQTYLAIADLGDGSPTLVVHTAKHYRLLRWSSANQQFD